MLTAPHLRLLIMLSNAYAGSIVARDPNPNTTNQEQEKYKADDSILDRIWTIHGKWFQFRRMTIYVLILIEFYSILSSPSSSSSSSTSPKCSSRLTPTPTFLLSSLLIHTGALIRFSCYNLLGPLFTFKLTLRPNHALITNGLYGVVRHPSYTGSLLFFAGLGGVLMGRGSWLGECVLWRSSVEGGEDVTEWGGVADVLGYLVAVDLVAHLTWTTAMLVRRTGREDRMMRREFGENWVRWAERTRYKMIPYVY